MMLILERQIFIPAKLDTYVGSYNIIPLFVVWYYRSQANKLNNQYILMMLIVLFFQAGCGFINDKQKQAKIRKY